MPAETPKEEEFLNPEKVLPEQGWHTDKQVYFNLAQLKEVMGKLLPDQQVGYTNCDHPHVENLEEFRDPKGEKERYRFWIRSEIEDLGIPLRGLESCMEILAAEGREEVARAILALLVEGQGDDMNYLEQNVSHHVDAVIEGCGLVYSKYPGDREFWKPEMNDVKDLGVALGRKEMVDRVLGILNSDAEAADTSVLKEVREYLDGVAKKDARVIEDAGGTIVMRLFYAGVDMEQYHISTGRYLEFLRKR